MNPNSESDTWNSKEGLKISEFKTRRPKQEVKSTNSKSAVSTHESKVDLSKPKMKTNDKPREKMEKDKI